MSPIDAFWHLLNFFAPAVFVGLFSAVVARWLWRRELRAMRWRVLLAWALGPTIAVAIAGLVVGGGDGRMLTYLGLVLAAALGIWLAGLVGGRR